MKEDMIQLTPKQLSALIKEFTKVTEGTMVLPVSVGLGRTYTPPKIRKVDLQEKLTMLAMYDEGYTLNSIAEYTGRGRTTVCRHIYKERP